MTVSPCSAPAADDGVSFFETRIRPQLAEHCYACHSSAAEAKQTLKGGLRLDTRDGLLRGGDSGPAIVPGEPEESLLVSALKHESLEMPPGGKLPERVVADFVRWIADGAPIGEDKTASDASRANPRDHWAFQPVAAPAIPDVEDESWPRDDLDRFVLAKLEENGREPAPEADARTLIRRVSYDLLGLPPTPRQLEALEAEDSPAAFVTAVDEMLESPHFGVHWARFWLDNVRFAQDDYTCGAFVTNGFDAAPYRDWLVRAFNADLPYDDFVRFQIAGDLIPHDDPDLVNADGITATGVWTFPHIVANNDPDKVLVDFVDQQLDVLGRTFLGLTLACARCHDHKFDPITQQDYYALAGIFLSSHSLSHLDPKTGKAPHARSAYRVSTPVFTTRQELADYERSLAEIERLTTVLRKMKEEHASVFELRKVRQRIQEQMDRDAKTDSDRQDRDSKLTELRAEETRLIEQIGAEVVDQQAETISSEHDSLAAQLKSLEQTVANVPRRPAMREGGSPGTRYGAAIGDVPVFVRGQHHVFGEIAPRSFPEVLCWRHEPPIGERTDGSGRLELANWIADPQHPLTARVMVNRIWQQLFGEGLVQTPSNFGTLGARPTHPELLDHLSRRFIESGWSIKRLVRDIVLSASYRQTSRVAEEQWSADPENRLFGRMNRKRLTGEQLYDTLGEISGELKRDLPAERIMESGRALYLKVSRIDSPHPLVMQFDVPDASLVVARRTDTTAATQTLFMLNNPMVLNVADRCGQRLEQTGLDDRERIEQAYREILGRRPTDAECELAIEIVEDFRSTWRQAAGEEESQSDSDVASRIWRDVCHVLLCGNEFLYVD